VRDRRFAVANNKRKALNYRLIFRGLFGRNRTVKFDTISLVKWVDPETPKTLDEVLPLAKAKLQEIRFKSGNWKIDEEPVELEDHEYGDRTITIETFALLSGKTIHQETV
jgi:hypothetical protein